MTHIPPAVSDFHSNREEHVVRIAKALGKGAKRDLFRLIYRGKRGMKSVKELADQSGFDQKRVLTLGKILFRDRAVAEVKPRGRVLGYAKIQEIINDRDRILRLAGDSAARNKVPTKRTPRISGKGMKVRVERARQFRASRISIMDIVSFRKAWRIRAGAVPDELDPPRLPEIQFKHGVRLIIGDKSKAQDWGGEYNDLCTTHLTLGKRRVVAAFAFKGPGKTGVLNPAKMGKLGNQIQRLVNSPAAPEVVFVQYEGDIDETVEEQLRVFAEAKAREQGRSVRYGTIGLVDSYRLRLAYPKEFGRAQRFVPKRKTHRR